MTSVGVMASAVALPSAVDVLMEKFNDFTTAPWTLNGTPTIVAGRTGTAASTAGANDRADYTIPSALRSSVLIIGFAFRANTTSTSVRQVCQLRSGGNVNEAIRLSYDGTTAQSFTITRLGGGPTFQHTTVTGLVPVATYAYLELQLVFGHSGSFVFRVNGTERLNVSGVDTQPSTDTAVDTVRIGALLSGLTNLYDDLYLTTGAGAAFKGSITIP